MAQFHVYRIGKGRLVLDVQCDMVNTGSRLVAPLFALGAGPTPILRLEPVLRVEGAV